MFLDLIMNHTLFLLVIGFKHPEFKEVTNSTNVTSFINIISVQKFAENIQLSQDNNSTSSTRTLFSHMYNFSTDKLILYFSTALPYPVQRDSNNLRAWLHFLKHLSGVSNVKLQRIFCIYNSIIINLHGISDASKGTYGSGTYLCFTKSVKER